jgi:hypothetical protein
MKELCRWMDIDKLRTTAYRPATNGMVKRFHRTLNSLIGKCVSTNQRDWDDRLQTVVAAYRASRHEATGFSPNMLMLGPGLLLMSSWGRQKKSMRIGSATTLG